ncbi:MAG: hypothetical protein JXQ75_06080 [Phycisphaerae bacterium]|nr:hypothetical protein [Phycisphaerae bacterium]
MSDIDAELIERRFAATCVSRRGSYFLLGLVALVVAGLMFLPAFGSRLGLPDVISVLLVVLSVSLLLLGGWLVGRRQRRCRQMILRAWEHVQLEEWDAAPAILDVVMQRPIRSSSDRGQAFMLLAAIAEHEGRYDRAAEIYETLLLGRIGAPLHLQQAQIALAAAKVRNQELTDAVDLLGRLEQVPMPQSLKAALDVVRLFQQVFMGQHEDAVQEYETRRELYRRHLSTHAAYGYGLLAAAMHHLGRGAEAARLWRDATMLVEASRLVEEYGLLAPIAEAYPETKKPSVLRYQPSDQGVVPGLVEGECTRTTGPA